MREKKAINIDIGRRIKAMRESQGMTQEVLAESIDVSVQYVSDLERGVVGASVPTIISICQVLDASSDYILMGKNTAMIGGVNRLDRFSDAQREILLKGINIIIEALTFTSN